AMPLHQTQAFAANDREHPTHDRGRRATKRLDRAGRRPERLLTSVLRVFRRATDLQTIAIHAVAVDPDEVIERGDIAGLSGCKQVLRRELGLWHASSVHDATHSRNSEASPG